MCLRGQIDDIPCPPVSHRPGPAAYASAPEKPSQLMLTTKLSSFKQFKLVGGTGTGTDFKEKITKTIQHPTTNFFYCIQSVRSRKITGSMPRKSM